MTISGKDAVRQWLREVAAEYGVSEATEVLRVASLRLAQTDGGTASDWYAAIQAAILERHPEVDEPSERPN